MVSPARLSPAGASLRLNFPDDPVGDPVHGPWPLLGEVSRYCRRVCSGGVIAIVRLDVDQRRAIETVKAADQQHRAFAANQLYGG